MKSDIFVWVLVKTYHCITTGSKHVEATFRSEWLRTGDYSLGAVDDASS